MNTKKITIDEFLSKIESLKEKSGVDLGATEDLSLAVMNLVSLEEHFFFTGVKTKNNEYFDTLQEIRNLRKELLSELMPNHEGETWCISKHLLGVTMRLIEVGNKLQSSASASATVDKENKKDEARIKFEQAYKVYSIFWALKLKLISGELTKETAKNSSRFEELVNKLADCCNE